jgi:hypothetical protein
MATPDPHIGVTLPWDDQEGIGAGARRGGGQRQSTRQQAHPAEPGAGDVYPQTFSGNEGKCESAGPFYLPRSLREWAAPECIQHHPPQVYGCRAASMGTAWQSGGPRQPASPRPVPFTPPNA